MKETRHVDGGVGRKGRDRQRETGDDQLVKLRVDGASCGGDGLGQGTLDFFGRRRGCWSHNHGVARGVFL